MTNQRKAVRELQKKRPYPKGQNGHNLLPFFRRSVNLLFFFTFGGNVHISVKYKNYNNKIPIFSSVTYAKYDNTVEDTF